VCSFSRFRAARDCSEPLFAIREPPEKERAEKPSLSRTINHSAKPTHDKTITDAITTRQRTKPRVLLLLLLLIAVAFAYSHTQAQDCPADSPSSYASVSVRRPEHVLLTGRSTMSHEDEHHHHHRSRDRSVAIIAMRQCRNK